MSSIEKCLPNFLAPYFTREGAILNPAHCTHAHRTVYVLKCESNVCKESTTGIEVYNG